MALDFKDIEILDLNMESSGINPETNMLSICFDLTREAPRDWRKQFLQEWSRIRRKVYRNAAAYRNHVCIDCNEEEVEDIYDWLKTAMKRTNQRYREYLSEKSLQGQPENERRRLQKLQRIRSTLGFDE